MAADAYVIDRYPIPHFYILAECITSKPLAKVFHGWGLYDDKTFIIVFKSKILLIYSKVQNDMDCRL